LSFCRLARLPRQRRECAFPAMVAARHDNVDKISMLRAQLFASPPRDVASREAREERSDMFRPSRAMHGGAAEDMLLPPYVHKIRQQPPAAPAAKRSAAISAYASTMPPQPPLPCR